MVERGILEANDGGGYRLKPRPVNDSSTRHWASPQIAAVLRQSGKKFDDLLQVEGDTETYYDRL